MRERRTMAELTGILTSLFVMLLIDFPAATTGQVSFNYIDVRDGDDVTLSCGHVKSDQDKCHSISWLFSSFRTRAAAYLIYKGQIHSGAKSKPDRLSVTENCSLVLKKVTVEDVGLYTCRQFDTSGRQQGPDSVVVLSVVTMTEQKLRDKVTFSCQVFRYDHCHQSVKWLFQDKDVDQNIKHFQTSQTNCYANVTFLDSHFIYSSRFKLFKCEVTNTVSGKVQQFSFRRQSSGEETGQDTTTTTTTTTTEPTSMKQTTSSTGEDATTTTTTVRAKLTTTKSTPTTRATTTTKTTTTSKITSTTTVRAKLTTTIKINTTAGTNNNNPKQQPGWLWWLIIAPVALAALLVSVVALIRLKKTKGNKTQMDENMADPEDGVSYASISFTRKTKSKARVQADDDDEGDAVTYSTVKGSSSSAGASTDPSSLYASINKPTR